MKKGIMNCLFLLLSLPLLSVAFTMLPSASVISTITTNKLAFSSSLGMAPKFDKQLNKWVPSSSEEGPEAGYDIWGTVIRHGPVPFFNRIVKADEYEQGVLKFMAGDKVDRMTAQAEMDAYLSNPNDWAYNRLQGYTVDYLSLDQKQLTLNLVWAVFIVSLLSRGVFCVVTGDYFFSFIPGAHSSNTL